MKSTLLSLIVLALVSIRVCAQDRNPTWFVFLVTGDNPPKATQEEIRAYQSAHIENFKRLFEEGKLVTAGPLQDTTRKKRGIVVKPNDSVYTPHFFGRNARPPIAAKTAYALPRWRDTS